MVGIKIKIKNSSSFLIVFPSTAILLQWPYVFHLDQHLSIFLVALQSTFFPPAPFVSLANLSPTLTIEIRDPLTLVVLSSFAQSIGEQRPYSLVRLFTPEPEVMIVEPTPLKECPSPLTKPDLILKR